MRRIIFIFAAAMLAVSGIANNLARNDELLKKARTLYWQGLAYESWKDVTPSQMVMASAYYREAAKMGYSLAQSSLGYMYEMGFTDDAHYKSDTVSAKYWFDLSYSTPEDETVTDFSRGKRMKDYLNRIKDGDKEAELQLGWLYWEAGVMYWDFCTTFNDSVINDYFNGKGKYGINANKKRRDYAMPLIKRGADYGVAQAQYIYGRTLYKFAIDFHRETRPDWSKYPQNVEDDQKVGVEYLRKASEQNHVEAGELLSEIEREQNRPMCFEKRILLFIMWIVCISFIIYLVPFVYKLYLKFFVFIANLTKKIVKNHLPEKLKSILSSIVRIICTIFTAITVVCPLVELCTPDFLHAINPLQGLI